MRIYLLYILLIALGVGPVIYKTVVLDLGLVPFVERKTWEIEFSATAGEDEGPLQIPVPSSTERVKAEQVSDHKLLTTDWAELAIIEPKSAKGPVKIRYQLETKTKRFPLPQKDLTAFYPAALKDFLEPEEISPEFEKQLEELEKAIVVPTKNKVKTVKDIYYYISEEVQNSRKFVPLEQTLLELRATSASKSRLFTLMVQRQGIPSRIVGGLYLIPPKEGDRRRKHSIHYWNEVYLGGKWVPVSVNKNLLGRLAEPFVPLFKGKTRQEAYPEGSKVKIYGQLAIAKVFSAKEYRAKIKEKSPVFYYLSLFNLPIDLQNYFRIILLIPLGALVLTLFRNLVGFKTFGIFMPVLIGVFFTDFSYFFGLFFFLMIILSGYGTRTLIHRLHLLAVPRLSIILTTVLIVIIGFSLVNQQAKWFPKFTPGLFPIVIATLFIERFTITLEEEGMLNTVKILGGTFAIATVVFFILSLDNVARSLFAHPELLFVIIALLVAAGRYTGFRLLELWRFAPLVAAAENRAGQAGTSSSQTGAGGGSPTGGS